MIDTCKIKSDPVLHTTASLDQTNDEDITDQVAQFDPVEFKRLQDETEAFMDDIKSLVSASTVASTAISVTNSNNLLFSK
jgi:hypothetical protein